MGVQSVGRAAAQKHRRDETSMAVQEVVLILAPEVIMTLVLNLVAFSVLNLILILVFIFGFFLVLVLVLVLGPWF